MVREEKNRSENYLSILFYEDFFLRAYKQNSHQIPLVYAPLSILFYEDFFLREIMNLIASITIRSFVLLSILFYEDFFLRELQNRLTQIYRLYGLSFNPLLWGFLFASFNEVPYVLYFDDYFQSSFMRISFCERCKTRQSQRHFKRNPFNPLLWGFLFASCKWMQPLR